VTFALAALAAQAAVAYRHWFRGGASHTARSAPRLTWTSPPARRGDGLPVVTLRYLAASRSGRLNGEGDDIFQLRRGAVDE
jgi:hypothetical protein